MTKIPKRINKCPIEEAIFEIRFSSDIPSDAVFGIIYSKIKDFFPKNSIKNLPVQQIPEQIRLQDQNLKYNALYRFQKDNNSLSIGPKVLIFGNSKEYSGWNKWSSFFIEIIQNIEVTDILNKVERIGLRYINVFDTNILNDTNIKLQLNKHKLVQETTNLRTELLDEGLIKILQIGNAVNIVTNGKRRKASTIDIDCIYNMNINNFFENYTELVNKAHDKEKELFYSLLQEDFINSLDPIY